jgi:hypothetical protein
MTHLKAIITATVAAALVLAVPAWADDWGRDGEQPAVRISPDLADRAEAALQRRNATVLDARERSFSTKRIDTSQVATNPDWFERAAAAAVRDDVAAITAASASPDVADESSARSGREVEWSQLGAGFGIGLLLALGAYAGVRIARSRPLAH